jgi:hypothetical protein
MAFWGGAEREYLPGTLAGAVLVMMKKPAGYQGEKFTFKLHTSPGKYLTGKVDQGQSFLIRTNHSQVQAVSV